MVVREEVWLPRCCRLFSILVICIFVLSFSGRNAFAEDLRLATTTSTDNSGLLAFLLPVFHADEGITVRVISVGTGKALNSARTVTLTWCLCTVAQTKTASSCKGMA